MVEEEGCLKRKEEYFLVFLKRFYVSVFAHYK